jgi:hypothetical protein
VRTWLRRTLRLGSVTRVVEPEGMWTWFHEPRAVRVGDQTYIVWHHDSGIQVGSYNHRHRSWNQVCLAEVTNNDHDVGVLGVLNDGRVMVCYSAHNGALRVQTSRRPQDIGEWDKERVLSDGLCTYPTLEYLANERRWYLFYRRREVSEAPELRKHMPFRMRTSEDNGATWSEERTIFDVRGHRPYVKVSGDGKSRLDFLCTDGHPNEFHDNSVYHFYYDGRWRDSFGTDIGEPSFTPSHVTRVHDGSTVPAWVWDVATGGVAVFATFNALDDHRYMRAVFDGKWTVLEIARAGTSIAADGTEPHYSAGVALDHADPRTTYIATFHGFESTLRRLTFDATGTESRCDEIVRPDTGHKHLRPVVVRGDSRVLWWVGDYDGYRAFHGVLRASPRW